LLLFPTEKKKREEGLPGSYKGSSSSSSTIGEPKEGALPDKKLCGRAATPRKEVLFRAAEKEKRGAGFTNNAAGPGVKRGSYHDDRESTRGKFPSAGGRGGKKGGWDGTGRERPSVTEEKKTGKPTKKTGFSEGGATKIREKYARPGETTYLLSASRKRNLER